MTTPKIEPSFNVDLHLSINDGYFEFPSQKYAIGINTNNALMLVDHDGNVSGDLAKVEADCRAAHPDNAIARAALQIVRLARRAEGY